MNTSFSFSLTYTDPADDSSITLDGSSTPAIDLFDFVGEEGISRLYAYEVTIASTDSSLPLDDLIGATATLTINQDPSSGETFTAASRDIVGIISEVQQGGVHDVTSGASTTSYFFYRFKVVPRIWKLGLFKRSRVFQSKNVPQIIDAVLTDDDGLNFTKGTQFLFEGSVNTEFATPATYEVRDYTVQYQETDLDFLCRLMEYEGIFFYFRVVNGAEVLVVTDQNPASTVTAGTISLAGPSVAGPILSSFTARRRMVSAQAKVFDHDFESFPFNRPAEATSSISGSTGVYEEYAESLRTARTATDKATSADDEDRTTARNTRRTALAARRSGELLTNQHKVFEGKSDQPKVAAGYLFTLDNHYRSDFNADYLFVQVRYAGSQRSSTLGSLTTGAPLLPSYGGDVASLWEAVNSAGSVTYVNAWSCAPSDVTYRPLRKTPVPRNPGIITATIAKHPGGDVIDEEGRYNVHMPFDTRGATYTDSDNNEQLRTLSRPVRMAQPYSGPDYGIHFPNQEGTEAVVGFIDGDIDRPIVLSTVPNPRNHTPVPNTNLQLPGENSPEGMGAAAVPAGEYIGEGDNQDAKTFGVTKNVIQTQRGHRLVMDDDTGTGNIGISLQVGAGEWPDGWKYENLQLQSPGIADPYWHSRIDMGGYRKKAFFEQFLDSASNVLTWLDAIFLKRVDVPEVVGLMAGVIASQMATGNYLADTYGDTAPVGITGVTDQAVTFQGINGVNLVMPNILGMWGAGVIPGMGPGQHRVTRAIVDFVIRFMYQDSLKRVVDEVKTFKDRIDDSDPDFPELADDWSWWRAMMNYEKNKKLQRVSGTLMSALGLPAINLSSVAGINMAAFGKVSVMGGYNGVELESKASISQHADLDLNIEAEQGIVIKAVGKPVGSPGFLGIFPRLIGQIPVPLPGFADKILDKIGHPAPSDDDCHLSIINENQDVRVLTPNGNIRQKAKQDVEQRSVEGDVNSFAHEGNILLEQGYREVNGTAKNDGSRINLVSGSGNAANSEIVLETTGSIQLSAGGGAAVITLRDDGTIDIFGKKINFKSTDELTLESKKIQIHAAMPAGPAPTRPAQRLDQPVQPPTPVPMTPPSGASAATLARYAKVEQARGERYAEASAAYAQDEAAYQANKAEWDMYDEQLANLMIGAPTPMAQIDVTAQPAAITVKTDTGDVTVACLNYAAESKVKYDYKGTLINGEAKGVLSTKAALTKIE